MHYVYRVSARSVYGGNNYTIRNDRQYARELFDYFAKDAFAECGKVEFSVSAVDAAGNVVNSCVLRSVDHYNNFD
jgi:hypothetical protein